MNNSQIIADENFPELNERDFVLTSHTNLQSKTSAREDGIN